MPQKNGKNDRQHLALAAARLRSEGLRQSDIAGRLKLSQPEVSRLLSLADEMKWINPNPTLVRSKIPDEIWRQVDDVHFSSTELNKLVRKILPDEIDCSVYIVRGTHNTDEFGRAAAARVAEIVRTSDTLGIMWGRSLATLVDGLAPLNLKGDS